MPVYLCKSGWDAKEPWRHGVQVYANPFPIQDDNFNESDITTAQKVGNLIVSYPQNLTANITRAHATLDADGNTNIHPESMGSINYFKTPSNSALNTSSLIRNPRLGSNGINVFGHPIRRVRHAEIVLADEVSIWYSRYWLRLRWPGPQGGFAGYIALGTVRESKLNNHLSIASAQMSVVLNDKKTLGDNIDLDDKDGKNSNDIDDGKAFFHSDEMSMIEILTNSLIFSD